MKRYLVAAGLVLMFAAPAGAATQIFSATFPVPNFSCEGVEDSTPIGPAPSTLTVIGAEVVFGPEYGYLNYAYLKDPAGNTMLIGGEYDIHVRQFFPTGTGFGFSTGQTGELIVNCVGLYYNRDAQMGAAATIYYTVP